MSKWADFHQIFIFWLNIPLKLSSYSYRYNWHPYIKKAFKLQLIQEYKCNKSVMPINHKKTTETTDICQTHEK